MRAGASRPTPSDAHHETPTSGRQAMSNGRDQFVYMALYGAKLAAPKCRLAGWNTQATKTQSMPWVRSFRNPQVAGVGLVTGAGPRRMGLRSWTIRSALMRAAVSVGGAITRGLIKLVAEAGSKRPLLAASDHAAGRGRQAFQTAAWP